MKPIVFEYQISHEEWTEGLVAILAAWSARDPYRPWMNVARLAFLVGLFFLWAVLGWSLYSLLAAAILLPVGEALIQRYIGRHAIGSTFDATESNVWLEISEDGVHERTRTRERRWLWDGVRTIFETENGLAFDLAGTDVLVLPGHAIDAERRAELEAGAAEFECPIVSRSGGDARAGLRVSEVAIIAQLAVATAVLSLAMQSATSSALVVGAGANALIAVLVALALAILLAAGGWFAAGAILRVAARRGAAFKTGVAWVLIILSIASFSWGMFVR